MIYSIIDDILPSNDGDIGDGLLKENFSPSGEESEEEAKEKDEVVGDLEQKFLAEKEEKTKGGPAGKAAVDPVPSFSAGLKGKPCRSEDTTLSTRMTRSLWFCSQRPFWEEHKITV
jgi:hypothetical protein